MSFHALARLLRRHHVVEEFAIEGDVLLRSAIVICVLCPVMMVSTFLSASYPFWRTLSNPEPRRLRILASKEREVLAGEDIACMDDSERREKDPCVAVRVTAPEVEQINPRQDP